MYGGVCVIGNEHLIHFLHTSLEIDTTYKAVENKALHVMYPHR